MKHSPAFLELVEEIMPRVREIRAQDVNKKFENLEPFLLVDVREDSEWQAGRIPGAIHIGRGVIERDIENTIPDKAMPIVLYCGGGYRSAMAADNMQKMGYTQVFSMAGGWRVWNEQKFPVI